MDRLTDIAHATAVRHSMFPAGFPVVVMVSGGADSVALLHLLAAGHLGDRPDLTAVHVNHLLRGDDAKSDEAFVNTECARLGVECRIERVDVAAYARRHGGNIEDAGREVRYRVASKEAESLAARTGAPPAAVRVAVAHTLDDRIETLCMRLLTGAGAGGLAAIRHVRGRVVRPLLDCPRPLVREWLTLQGFAWREDPTNADTTRLRAHIRHELLPVLERIAPAFRTTLARSMTILAEEDEMLSSMAAELVKDFSVDSGFPDEIALDRAMMRTLPMPMRRRVVRYVVAEAFPHASRLDSEHVEAIVSGLDSESFARDLPYGLRAYSEYGRMIVTRQGDRSLAVAPCLLPIPGTVDLGLAGTLHAEPAASTAEVSGPDEAVVDVGEAMMLAVGAAQPGDRMRPLGMVGTRKLSDMLIDAKVPRRERSLVPVVRDGDRIVWVAGVRMSEECKVGPHTRRAVRLTWERRVHSGAWPPTTECGE
ncbi:MAG: tRNA lysidine(34) synthetase TilS [Clostridiales bacterium]|nr:tRNA lysidine(34) synthetase TilS [Clostridiales bacterium]